MAARSATLAVIAFAAVVVVALGAASVSGFSILGEAETGASGSLRIAGSESMRPVIAACAEDFMARSPQADVIIRGGGSGDGISALLHGLVEIGMSSRGLTDKERDYAAAKNIDLSVSAFAVDGIAVVVHPSNALTEIDLAQLAGIYSGSIRSWHDLAAAMDGEIVTVGRAPGSGTASLFAERVLGGTEGTVRQKLATNEAIVDEVAARPEAMGYAGLGAVHKANGRVKVVAIRADPQSAAVAPAVDTLRSGTYPLARTLYLLHAGPPSKIADAFLAHCLGPDAQALIQRAGYVAAPPATP
jgi:phosphate transport system substrate-binding protein